MGGGDTTTYSKQKSELKLPGWVEDAGKDNYRFAERIANKKYQEYGGERVAPLMQDTMNAFDFFRDNAGAGSDQLGAADFLYNRAGGGILGLDREAYMNPWIDNVEKHALGALEDSRIQTLMHNADRANAASAFGGSRGAIVDAVTNAETNKDAGQLAANLRAQGYDNASALMQNDINTFLQTGQAFEGLSNNLQNMRDRTFGGLLGIGQTFENKAQQYLDDDYSRWEDKKNHDLERLNILMSSLGMTPYGTTQKTSGSQTVPTQGPDWAQAGLGAFSLLAGLSDRNEKTDIKKLGTDENTGLPMYSYRYKGDPKSYPKVVGPMAQDVEKMYPGSTGKTPDGKMTVPLGILAQVAA